MGGSTDNRMGKCAPLVQQDTITALGHGIRVDILRILNEKVASARELADVLEETTPHVSYHVRVLAECGHIEPVRKARKRGATQTFYQATRAPFVDDELARKLPESVRQAISVEGLEAIYHEAAESIRAGLFDKRTDRHVSWVPMEVDEEGWRELVDLLAKTLEGVERIKADNAKRLVDSDEPRFSAIASLLGFEIAPSL